MAVSRIAFALADAMNAIRELSPGGPERPGFAVDLAMDLETFERVVSELEYHHGGKLQRDQRYRGLGKAMRYTGIRLIAMPPGNRNG